MKKEVEVTHKAKTIRVSEKKEIISEFYCDICGLDIDKNQNNRYGSCNSRCELCGRDICRHITNNYGKFTCMRVENDWDDFPSRYCIYCYDLRFTIHNDLYEKEQNSHAERLARLDAMIKELSLAKT